MLGMETLLQTRFCLTKAPSSAKLAPAAQLIMMPRILPYFLVPGNGPEWTPKECWLKG